MGYSSPEDDEDRGFFDLGVSDIPDFTASIMRRVDGYVPRVVEIGGVKVTEGLVRQAYLESYVLDWNEIEAGCLKW